MSGESEEVIVMLEDRGGRQDLRFYACTYA